MIGRPKNVGFVRNLLPFLRSTSLPLSLSPRTLPSRPNGVAADFERAFRLARATDDASLQKLKAWLHQHVYKGKLVVRVATAKTVRHEDRVQLLVAGPFDDPEETIPAAEQTVVLYRARVEVFAARMLQPERLRLMRKLMRRDAHDDFFVLYCTRQTQNPHTNVHPLTSNNHRHCRIDCRPRPFPYCHDPGMARGFCLQMAPVVLCPSGGPHPGGATDGVPGSRKSAPAGELRLVSPTLSEVNTLFTSNAEANALMPEAS